MSRRKKRPPHEPVAIGLDGWPIDPNHPANQPALPLEEIRARRNYQRLRGLERAWREGGLKAVSAAIKFCWEEELTPPRWLIEATESMANEVLAPRKQRTRRKQGRHADDAKNYARWDLVKVALDNGYNLEEACARAAEYLEGSPEWANEPSIRKSYYKVERDLREGRGGRFGV